VAVEPANVAETGIAVALGLSAAIGAGVRLVKPSILAQAINETHTSKIRFFGFIRITSIK
jgi:hypothetical protein